jgi:KUP system potassium uptake protein
MASLANGVPPVVVHHVARIRVLHESVVFVTAQVGHTPHVSEKKRTTVEDLGKGFYRVIVRFGFMEQPNIPRALKKAKDRFDLPFDLTDATYYLGRETFLATAKGNMGSISEGLFSFLSRNAKSASTHFNIPPEQVVELGTQIDL